MRMVESCVRSAGQVFAKAAVVLALAMGVVATTAVSAWAVEMDTIAGSTSHETAALHAVEAYPEGSDIVVLVNEEAWADALSATGLAGALDCPLLYTAVDALPEETKDALATLGTTRVAIIGSTGCVSEAVEAELLACGVAQIDRVAGLDRFATQMAVYEYGKTGFDGASHWEGSVAIIASGMSFADALSAASLAYAQKVPIFLADPAGNLSDEQDLALFELRPSKAILLGGESLVSDTTYGFARALTGAFSESGEPAATRLAGANRYGTSAAVARWATSEGLLNWEGAAFATGLSASDALVGSVTQGKKGSVMLLADDATAATIAALAENAEVVTEVSLFDSAAVFTEKMIAYLKLSVEERKALPMGGYLMGDGTYVWSDSTGADVRENDGYKLWFDRASRYTSATDWMLIVDTLLNEMVIFHRTNGSWAVDKHWLCSTGAWATPTVKGEFTIQLRGLSFGSGFTCWYWTQFYGDYLFHSVTYNPGSMTSIQEGQLGVNISHGCVRLDINNAKWIYDNIPYGSKVVIF